MEEPVSLGRFTPRDGWKAGPWDLEDDRYEWRHEGSPCLIVRGPMGALCGYVGVPPEHPWHGKHSNDLEYHCGEIEVHGGITYAAGCKGYICHVPRAGESDDVWWVGFDTNHCFDVAPGMHALLTQIGRESSIAILEDDLSFYRTLEYVADEVRSLAKQARACVTE